ncbi:spherulation-specific family 4 protein [Streptomyces sp. NPDC051214]|uniref:spherulation-specific family 4 protein n=1 Tax=Streptomyces sp. NPDC051214 TaxID=3155282 RepID=UPI00342A00BD
MTLLVPLYVHPAADPAAWQALVAAAPQLYGVVLNAADGPGAAPDPAFTAASRALREAGVRVLGYVDTAYGERPLAAVTDDLERHRAWYGVDGCFLDQVASGRRELRHCRRMVRAARERGAGTVVLNTGVHPAPGYARAADLIVTFEGHWTTYLRSFDAPSWTARHPPEQFCHLVYGVPPALARLAGRTAVQRGAGVHCAVPGAGPNPWTQPPPLPVSGGPS